MWKYIWIKEIKELLFTWKSTLWLLITSLIFSFISYLLLTDKELSLLDQTELLWLLGKIIFAAAILIVSIDASSSITSEFEKETIESLLLTPLRLREFIIGKLLSSLTLWFFIFLVATPYIIVCAAGTKLVFAFLEYIALLGTFGIVGFVMIIFAVSFFYRTVKNTLTTSLILLLAFGIPALFSSTLNNNALAQFFGAINPIDNMFASLDNVLVDYQLSILQNMKFLLPLLVFCFLSFIFLLIASQTFEKEGVMKNE